MKSFGQKAWMLPQPVLIIGTYNGDGTANAMNAAWGGQWDAKEIMISMGKHATTENLARCNEFTVAFATKKTMVAADFVGIVSAKNDPEKMQIVGEQIKLARLRRNLSMAQVAERATCSELTLSRVEKGLPTVSIGIYLRVLYALQLDDDILLIAKEDPIGRGLQDLQLKRRERATKKV